MNTRSVLRTALITLGIMIVTTVLSYMDVMGIWDNYISDVLTQQTSGVNKKIYIIGIDDRTLQEYGMISEWGRKLSGRLVEILNENENAGPAVIGLDIIYSETADEEGDAYFANACRKAGNVVTASRLAFKEQPRTDDKGYTVYNQYNIDYMINPYDSLNENTASGFVNTPVDSDGYVRKTMAYMDYEGERIYSFAYTVYMEYMKTLNEEAVLPKTYGEGNLFYFTYSGKPGSYTVISMADVLDGKVDTRIFNDAVVLVGAYAVGMQDSYKPAVAHDKEMYGVEIHANIIQALLENKTKLPVSRTVYAVVMGILCGLFFLVAKKLKIIKTVPVLAVMAGGSVLFAKIMYRNGYILPVILFPALLVIIFAEQLIEGYVTEHIRRRRVVSVFKQYVAPQVVDKISKNRDFELVLGGENRHVAVLFVDIRGFTTISESLEPEQVVEILNEYLSLTTKAIFDNEGTLDKFVGDAAMAVFNAPFDLDDYIYRSVCAAWDMKKGADVIADKFKKRFGESVEFGIGVNCGNAVVGNIGCNFRMDYTAIGDTVNTAARLESNAKAGQILISDAVYESLKDRIKVTPVGEIPLKGKNRGVFVYQLDEVIGR
ncbi:MAG: CHASE2 domain-containing protein [Butyrivibrio sp.]